MTPVIPVGAMLASRSLQEDGLSTEELARLVDTFPRQPLDFYGAIRCASCRRSDCVAPIPVLQYVFSISLIVYTLYGACRAATYDHQIRRWIREDVVQTELTAEDANMKEFGRRLLKKCALLRSDL